MKFFFTKSNVLSLKMSLTEQKQGVKQVYFTIVMAADKEPAAHILLKEEKPKPFVIKPGTRQVWLLS